MRTNRINIVLEEELKSALAEGKPVVALESTIIAHGMPYPTNLETAAALESTVRQNGAVPATCAVINGVCKVGLSKQDLEILATEKCMKLSTRDIPFATALGKHGATTVAATMLLAEAAGIEMFATGGIGGVHRGFEQRLDISTDLIEMSRTNVSIVSAGCKSILDIPNTLEYLETMAVPVIGYQTDDFPAFYSRKSGEKVAYRMDDPEIIAKVIIDKRKQGLDGAVLIANPIDEKHAIPFKEIEEYVQTALAEAEKSGVNGKELTPFLLKRISEMTAGRSLASNVELVRSNAALAAQIAVGLKEA